MENLKLELPELDLNVLKEKAQEAAMAGAIKEIEDYYTGYRSPFKEAIRTHLASKSASIHFDIPDIIANLNTAISKEMDRITNNAVAQSFIPLVQQTLIRADKEVKFSDLLMEFLRCNNYDYDNDLSMPIVEITEEKFWKSITISYQDHIDNEFNYRLTLHHAHTTDDNVHYQLLSLPHLKESGDNNHSTPKSLELISEGVSLKLPFTKDTLSDKFTAYIASLVINQSIITMDCEEISEEMMHEIRKEE